MTSLNGSICLRQGTGGQADHDACARSSCCTWALAGWVSLKNSSISRARAHSVHADAAPHTVRNSHFSKACVRPQP